MEAEKWMNRSAKTRKQFGEEDFLLGEQLFCPLTLFGQFRASGAGQHWHVDLPRELPDGFFAYVHKGADYT